MQTRQSNDLPNRQLVNLVTDHLSKMSHDPTIGKELYKFIDKYKIGQNDYGALMDAAAKGKQVMAHRLYGHHLIYDFPSELNNVIQFLEHEVSDVFTTMGLPIVPGEVLEAKGFLKHFQHIPKSGKPNWNFVNAYDILAGTVAIYSGGSSLGQALKGELVVDDLPSVANTLGIGALELSIAISCANPFLLVGALLHIASGFVGLTNDRAILYFDAVTQQYQLRFVAEKSTLAYKASQSRLENRARQSRLHVKAAKSKL